ncbi:MAG: hypothetical protein EPN97_15790 [Alphaproteobacteria bacterium]|nr:MAG: hypothetical protein EPN97_15790 [Alphaproteobacteria bacterium]
MKLKKSLLVLFAAAGLMTGCAPTPPAQVQQSIQQTFGADLQNTLTGYFNSHGMKAGDVKEGLTIPWVASAETMQKINDSRILSTLTRSGYMVATGEKSDAGCPVFKVTTIFDNGEYTSREDTKLPVCPKLPGVQ